MEIKGNHPGFIYATSAGPICYPEGVDSTRAGGKNGCQCCALQGFNNGSRYCDPCYDAFKIYYSFMQKAQEALFKGNGAVTVAVKMFLVNALKGMCHKAYPVALFPDGHSIVESATEVVVCKCPTLISGHWPECEFPKLRKKGL